MRIRRCATAATLVAVLGLFIIVSGRPAQAASFDCSKAELPLDKLICTTPELSAKDDEMAAKYKTALAVLSSEGQGILRDGQRKWLKFARTHCTARMGQPADKEGGDAIECLKHEYDDRLRQLIASAQRIGPYTFSEVDDFQLTPSAPDDQQGYRSGFIYRVVSYPRIDTPATPATRKWNELAVTWVDHIKQTAFKPDSDQVGDISPMIMLMPNLTDFDVDFEIVSAQAGFISLCQYVTWYDHPRAHRNADTACSNFLVDHDTALTEAELFKASSGWQAAVSKFVADAATSEDQRAAASSITADSGVIPWNWSMTADALNFFVDTGADYGNPGRWGFDVTIPWRELKPYLRADLPIKLNTE